MGRKRASKKLRMKQIRQIIQRRAFSKTALSIFAVLFAGVGSYFILKSFAAGGQTYYVSRDGNNADGTSWTTAWNDLNQIDWNVINAGDTIKIDGGSTACASNYDFSATRPGVSCGMLYNSTLTVGKSGTSGSPVTIELATDAGHNGTAVFFGGRTTPLPYCTQPSYSPQTSGTLTSHAVVVGNYQYVVLEGMKRSGIMIYGYTSDAVVMNSGSASNDTMRNLEVFDNGSYSVRGDGTYITDSKGIQPEGSNLMFERLLIHDNGQDAFQSGGPISNITVQDSWMYMRRSNPLYPGFAFNAAPFNITCQHVDGIQIYGGGSQPGLTIKDDVFGPLLSQGIYPSDVGTYVNNVTINNVLLLNANWNNINSDQQSDSTVPQNWTIQNITGYDDGSSGPDSSAGQVNVEVGSGSNMSITNSIIYHGSVHFETFTGSNNVYYGTNFAIPGGTNMNPQFVSGPSVVNSAYSDFAAADFTPQCGAACTGVGSTIHSIQDILDLIDSLNTTPSTPAPGDCDNSGHVDVIDLSLLLSNYGQVYSACDFNSDGIVNVLDLSVLLSNYGL